MMLSMAKVLCKPNFIQIGQWEGKIQHTLYTLEATLTSPLQDNPVNHLTPVNLL